jgi:hypothetical protein
MWYSRGWPLVPRTGGAYVPTVVVGMAPFAVLGIQHASICMPWAFIVALWHAEDPTMGAYVATTDVATYAPPAFPSFPLM